MIEITWICKVNPYPADDDYRHFESVLFVDQITDIGKKYVFKHQDLQRIDLKLNKYQ